MKTLLKNQFKNKKVNLVRYADDWVITAESREIAEQVKIVIEGFLAERGLSISDEKTKIVHINEGFDFLSWNFRKYGGKLLIKPSKKAVATITRTISDIIRYAKSVSQEVLIEKLNPVIRGWSLYHRNVVSADTFSRLDNIVWVYFGSGLKGGTGTRGTDALLKGTGTQWTTRTGSSQPLRQCLYCSLILKSGDMLWYSWREIHSSMQITWVIDNVTLLQNRQRFIPCSNAP